MFLSTFVATGNIKQIEMNNEPLATYKSIYSVSLTVFDMFWVSLRIACVESEMEDRMLLREFVKMKKTDVWFRVS